MRKLLVLVLAALVSTALLIPSATSRTQQESTREYVVVYEKGVSLATARAAVERIGGTIVKENRKVGVATVRTSNDDFVADAVAQRALFGAASNRPVGTVGPLQKKKFSEERLDTERQASMRGGAQAAMATGGAGENGEFETFAPLQWDMQMIGATRYESHDVQPGDPGVRVGILDTGIDGLHPDIAPNFDSALSRNFTTDIETIVSVPCEDDPEELCEEPLDGPCADEPDNSCSDPADVDENGHGTHVAGTVGAAVNGLGIAGVAPKVTLINIRAGQDSGYFFLQPSVDALTYAADIGVDVVNMSYYIDPWLFNCRNNGGLVRGSGRAADNHRGHSARAAVRPWPRRHPDRLSGKRSPELRPEGRDRRRDEPGLPARDGVSARDHGGLSRSADRGQERHQRHCGRPEHAQGVLLRLWTQPRGRLCAGRRLPRLPRDAPVPDAREPRPLGLP